MMNVLITLILYALVFVVCEIAYRQFNLSFLLSRKMAHIVGSIISFSLPYLMSNFNAISIGLFFTLVILISKKNYILKSIHDKEGSSVGEVVYPLGIALSAFFIWPLSIAAYQGSCLVFGFADGLAGYIGSKYGKKNYCLIEGKKTIEGSIIFFLFTATIFGIYYFLYIPEISLFGIILLFFYALIVTLLEALFTRGWDNLVIPIAAGIALLLIVA